MLGRHLQKSIGLGVLSELAVHRGEVAVGDFQGEFFDVTGLDGCF